MKPEQLPRKPPARPWVSWLTLAAGPGLLLLTAALYPSPEPAVGRMAGVALWMALWWVTEVVPIPVTALLPLVVLPALGILPIDEVAPNYGRSVIFLFLGGFLLALALQASGAHRRLALAIVAVVGDRARRLVLGFMLASAFLSMWISNTATVMVLLPIALSVLSAIDEGDEDDEDESYEVPVDQEGPATGPSALATCALLGIAYAADIGGMATLVGTPPNIAYSRLLTQVFPDAPAPSFAEWTMLTLPMSLTFLLLGWVLLTALVFRLPRGELLGGSGVIAGMRSTLGPIGRDEWATGGVFVLTATLWMSRGSASLPGWSHLPLFEEGFVDDAFVAVAMALLLFMLPSERRPGERLLEWRMTRKVPWGLLLLFGGGFALAAGFTSSGLSGEISTLLTALSDWPTVPVMAGVCLILTFLTELTSNTATTQMVLPILATAGAAMEVDPRALMIPATLSASCAFMMPVASPTQAIVFGTGKVPIREMVRAGIWFNLLGVLLVVLAFVLLAEPAMGIDVDQPPAWSQVEHAAP